MPLKWKIYYWLAWYYLVWDITAMIFIIYLFFISGEASGGTLGAVGLVLICLMLLTIFKPLISFQFIRHLKGKTVFTETELNLFVAGFVVNIAIMLFAGCLLFFEIAYMPDNGISVGDVLAILTTAIFVFACVYLLVHDVPLKKLISKQRVFKPGAFVNDINNKS